jgi:hypothetical protein
LGGTVFAAAEGRLDSDEEDEILEALHERELAEETVLGEAPCLAEAIIGEIPFWSSAVCQCKVLRFADPLHEARNVRRVPQFLVGLTSSIAAGVIGGMSLHLILHLRFFLVLIILVGVLAWLNMTTPDFVRTFVEDIGITLKVDDIKSCLV